MYSGCQLGIRETPEASGEASPDISVTMRRKQFLRVSFLGGPS